MNRHGYIGRKQRQPKLEEKPAIVIVAFGSSSRAAASFEYFDEIVRNRFPDYFIFWAYTSAVIRKKTGKPSLHEALARIEAANFRKVVVQPLHVFPGTEYQQLAETCEYFPGLRVFQGETLMHRWDFVEEVLSIIEKDFLAAEKGLNLLVLHGTPLASDPVNTVYLGLDHLLRGRYENVIAASIEGIPDFTSLKRELTRKKAFERWPEVRIIPLLHVAGLHVEDDLMGEESWRQDLLEMGFGNVETLTAEQNGKTIFKGLGHNPAIIDLYCQRLERALQLARFY